MPSISQHSWGSEVHFPRLMAGLAELRLLGPDWETVHMGPLVTLGELGEPWQWFWSPANFRGALARWKDGIFFLEAGLILGQIEPFSAVGTVANA